MEHPHGQYASVTIVRQAISRGKRNGNITASVTAVGAHPAQGNHGAFGQALQLPLIERNICGHDNDNGSLVLFTLSAHPCIIMLAANDQIPRLTEVRHDNDSHGLLLVIYIQYTRGRVDTALKPHTDHTRTAAHRTFGKVFACSCQGSINMLWPDMKSTDIIEFPIVAFGNQTVDCAGGNADIRIALQHILDKPLTGGTHTERIGHENRSLNGTKFFNLNQADAFPKAIYDRDGSHHLFNENIIGKSREFWMQLYPEYCREIPALSKFTFDEFYTSLIHPQPSTCRMVADELTYTLHIIIRFELERDVFAGKLTVNELEDAWNDKYQRYLGVCPSSPREGILQDIHWASGHVGYFQSYALGDMYAAQIKAKLMQAVPDAFSRLANGDGSTINKWLQQNVWQYGMTYTPEELIVKATGAPLSAQHLIDHLTDRYLPNK